MPVALDSVVKQLEDSGIIAPGKLKEFIPPQAAPKDGEELIRELFKKNHLTRFQAQQVAAGRAKSLILGGYVLLDKIGAGGMGQVFKAEHRRMKRLVAIKMLPSAMTKDPAAVARFQREVEAAAKLRHPNIVAADDADEANGVHFLVMEYVEGSDLSALVKKHGTLPGSKALNYILQAAKGLEFAHKKGVVHRDIKPANLLVDSEGTVKILDMGLARIDSGGDQATQAELTGTGAVMGTVDYMAPEQALSTKGVDARADIYSLGCTLYYLLAGKCTYDGDTLMAKLLAHREAPIPSLADVQEGVPPDVQALFSKMVAKKAEDRYQSMTAVIADLERAISGQSAPGSLAPPATTSDTGLSKIFQTLPSSPTQIHQTGITRTLAPPNTPAGSKVNPKLILYGSIAGGAVALIGIALVLWLAFSGSDDLPPKIAGPKGIQPPLSPPPVVSSAVARPAGNFALRFNQRGQKVEAPNVGLDVSSPFTIEAYATPGVVPDNAKGAQFFRIDDEFGLGIDGKCWIFYTTHNHAQAGVPLVPQRRVHLAGVRTRSKRLLYVDGQLAGEVSEPLNVRRDPNKPLRPLILESPFAGFTQLVDQIRISQGERYSGNFTPPPILAPEPGTLALYSFSEGTGGVVADSSGQGHHAKISGATWVNVDGSPITSSVPQPNVVYLDDLPEKSYVGINNRFYKPGKSAEDAASMATVFVAESPVHALMMHPPPATASPDMTSRVVYDLAGGFSRFQTQFRVRSRNRAGPIFAEVWGDGKKLWESGDLVPRKVGGATADVDLRGVRELTLVARAEIDSTFAHTLLIEPRLTPLASSPSSQTPVPSPTPGRWPFDPPDGKEYVWSAPENLGTTVNTSAGEMVWGISADERQLYFQRDRTHWVAHRSADGAAFSSLNPLAGLPGGQNGSVSASGLVAALVANRGGGQGEIWLASRAASNLPFSAPQAAPPPVNGDWQSDRPVLSPDGLSLLTLSTRKTGAWAEVWLFTRPTLDQPFVTGENLGTPPNTPDWDMPYYVSNDRCFVIVSSQGGSETGGERIVRYFMRAKPTDPFGPGVELDIPLGEATRVANSGFRLSADGRVLYFESHRLPGGQGKSDIWVTRRVPKPKRWPLTPSKPEEISWLQSLQATVTLRSGPDKEVVLKPTDPVPAGSATIVGIQFSYDQGGALVTDQVLQRVATLGDLESLKCVFSGSNVPATATALPSLASLVNLRQLALGRIGPSTTDPAFLAKLQNLESLALQNLAWQGWEPHVAQLKGLKDLDLYNLDRAQLEQLGPLPNLTHMRFAGYATGNAQRLPAAQRFAQVVPWCRLRLFGMDGDNGKELVLEPTAPLPGRSASGASAGSSSSAADPAGSGSPAAPDLALERKVAQWLLDWKLPVQLSVQGQKVEVRPGSPLPAEPFTVLSLLPSAPVEIPGDVLQAGLADFAKLSGFTGSYLPKRDSDQWAEAWVKIPTAVVVNAAGCDLTDRGLSAWSQVPRLSYLNLGKCPNVTGAGLAALASCREIGTLELEPEVFAAGKYTLADAQKLRAALPSTRIQFAGGKPIPGLTAPVGRRETNP